MSNLCFDTIYYDLVLKLQDYTGTKRHKKQLEIEITIGHGGAHFNLSSLEAEAGGSLKFEASLRYIGSSRPSELNSNNFAQKRRKFEHWNVYN